MVRMKWDKKLTVREKFFAHGEFLVILVSCFGP